MSRDLTITKKQGPALLKTPSERVIAFVASDGLIDREGDIIEPSAWNLDAYRSNPVICDSHDYRKLPIARAMDIAVVGQRLIGRAEFPPAGLNEASDRVYGMVKAGFLNATSVGFRSREPRRNAHGGWTHHDVELLEVSLVSVPANPRALITGKSAQPAAAMRAWVRGAAPAAPAVRWTLPTSPFGRYKTHAELEAVWRPLRELVRQAEASGAALPRLNWWDVETLTRRNMPMDLRAAFGLPLQGD